MKLALLYTLLFTLTISFAQQKTTSVGFVENKGQIVDEKGKKNDKVLYLLNTNGLNVQLRKSGFSYDVYEVAKHIDKKQETKKQTGNSPGEEAFGYKFQRVDIDFLGSNKSAFVTASGKSTDYDNYYTTSHAPEGILYVYKYEKVTYRNIYPNVDVIFFIPSDKSKPVEYNFIIHPGGKVSDIKMCFKGAATELRDNKIKMNFRFGVMEETLPLSWQEDGGSKQEAQVYYRKIKNNVYGFAAINNPQKTLVIDPVPDRLWGTYYGGGLLDYPLDVANGPNNSVYMCGITSSTNNIATTGSFIEPIYIYNGFVVKFNTNGERLWGIYYLGRADVMNVDINGNVYFTGSTFLEDNLATPGSHQPERLSITNSYLIKFNNSGIREWGTYYGGSDSTYGRSICFDDANNVYLAGDTYSPTNIATPGSHQPQDGGSTNPDGFLTKFSPTGTQLWGTYYGGTGTDRITSVVFSNGFIYLSGNTISTDKIATPGAYIPTYTLGQKGMVVKFNTNGERIWGTYFGKTGNINIRGSSIIGDNLYLHGVTTNTDLKSAGTFNPDYMPLALGLESGSSSYIIKFNVANQEELWGTYFNEYIQDIAVNNDDYLLFTGCTNLNEGIATPGSYSEQKKYGDAYFIKLSPDGQRVWGTYYGGNGDEDNQNQEIYCNHISLDSDNNIYITGDTFNSTEGLASPGAHQTNFGNDYRDCFLAKFRDCDTPVIAGSNSPVCVGKTIELKATGGINYSWIGPDGFTSNQQNPIIDNAGVVNSGEYKCLITGNGKCDGTILVNVTVGDNISPLPNVVNLPVLSGNCNNLVITFPTATDNCMEEVTATTMSPLNYTTSGTYTIVWDYQDNNNNISHQNQTIIVTAQPLPIAQPSQSFCYESLLSISDILITGENIKWYDAVLNGNMLQSSSLLTSGMTYYVSQTIGGCESERIPITITIHSTPKPTGNPEQHFCNDQNPSLADLIVNGSNIAFYDSETGGNILPLSTALTNGNNYWVTQKLNSCESTERLVIKASITNEFPASNYDVSVCDDLNDGFESVDLTLYNNSLVSNSANYNFTYYKSLLGAENESVSELINGSNGFSLHPGINIIYVHIRLNAVCYKIVELKMQLISSPDINLKDIYGICEDGSVTINGFGNYDSYEWSNGSESSSTTIYEPGDYWLTVTKNNEGIVCSDTKNFEVVLSEKPRIKTIEIKDWTDSDNTIAVFTSEIGNFQYSLDGLNYQDSNYFYGLPTGKYKVYVKDKNDCGVDYEEIFLLSYPKFFTPNDDGQNDVWKIEFSFWEPGLIVEIYDRYGKTIKSLSHKDSGWDGTLKGHHLPSTDYWFVVKRADGTERKGHFSLIR
ncbi:hypothetical protein AMR72_08560 [Flavobacterium psychrophilum]|nr:hypothetical protein AMR72_08560 [Flavobacterium psychrophilum]AOE52551.1 hypothetical protein ALW18_08550 [Flavobacterium psychrophilum]